MWQGKSLIPKPRLTTPRRTDRPPDSVHTPTAPTPRRTPRRTPSRTPRPPSRFSEETTSFQPPTPKTRPINNTHPPNPTYRDNTYTSQPSAIKRGDRLAEQVIATGIISSGTTQQSAHKYHSSYAFKRFEKRDETSAPDPLLTSPYSFPKTPPSKLKPSHIQNTDLANFTFAFTTPECKTVREKTGHIRSNEELVIDEELVKRTPAKHKNTEWLASFGIDISLLNIHDDDADEENHDPNETPPRALWRKEWNTDESYPSSNTNSRASQRRRATDFYGYAQSTHENLAGTPTRVASARKTRRASTRISIRELDALKYNNCSVDIEAKKTADNVIRTGSDIFLTPVRATRKQREKNGTAVVLSEVRRSLRINTPSSKLVPKNSVRGRIELLEANEHSYMPNPTLNHRGPLFG